VTTLTTEAPARPVTRLGTGMPRRLVMAAAFAVTLAAAIYLLLVRTSLGHRFDDAALLGSRLQANRSADVGFLNHVTAANFTIVVLAIAAFGLVRRKPWLGITAAACALIAVIGTDVLKDDILTRPILVRGDTYYTPNTFPSGHTATAVACALALVIVSPPAWRGITAVLAGSIGWIIAADVQTVGWHRPSDALGAALVSFAVVAVGAALLARIRPVTTGRRIGHIPSFLALGAVWVYNVAVSILNAARVLRYLHSHADIAKPTLTVQNDAFQFGVHLTVALVVTLLAALLLLLGPYDLDGRRRRAQ
jgi:membrane-associated phospholipid phosphatase